MRVTTVRSTVLTWSGDCCTVRSVGLAEAQVPRTVLPSEVEIVIWRPAVVVHNCSHCVLIGSPASRGSEAVNSVRIVSGCLIAYPE